MEVVAWTKEQKQALEQLRVQDHDSDLRFWPVEELREAFAAASSGRLLTRVLVRNLVYQAATWSLSGQAEPLEGNLRSVYYSWVKPVVARLPETHQQSTDPYEVMLNAFETFVVKLKLWRYGDLDLVDERWDQRLLSDGRNPHVLLYAEKTGFMRTLKRAAAQHGVTVAALGGFPSFLSTEYLAVAIQEQWPSLRELVLVGITDHDPSGRDIQSAFADQLTRHGFTIREHHSLIRPEVFEARELELLHFHVRGHKSRIKRWLTAGGGIDGQPRGMEADALPKTRLRDLIAKTLHPHLGHWEPSQTPG